MAKSGFSELKAVRGVVPTRHLRKTDFTANVKLNALVERVAAGDFQAMRTLHELTLPTLLPLAQTVLRNHADAEEVICDVYTQVWQSASQYQPSRGTVMAWLLMICRTRAVDRYRYERRYLDTLLPEESVPSRPEAEASLDLLVDTLQQNSAMRGALARLTPVRRQILGLAFFRDLSHKEIATATQLALGTVKSHIRRALATLRKSLGDTRVEL